MRGGAVEAQRVALAERVDLAVEVDLDRAARDVDRDLASLDVGLIGPAACRARATRAGPGRRAVAGQLAHAVLVALALVAGG